MTFVSVPEDKKQSVQTIGLEPASDASNAHLYLVSDFIVQLDQ